MMSQQDRRILAEFTKRVCERFPEARIWAFGSRARGGAGWDSDFDICIVLDRIDHIIDRWIRDVAWEIGFENDRVITTVLINKEQFEQGPMSESTLVANILREGISA
ncbi:MAG: nucleotidyltransferase domain-containing protein [Deltaproteobacteria bacterium]|nr:nucleotidyltransferase domain-containing protein [Deltaproteobacteria bacterium]MBW2014778.1 nucleotidyltransferase domain-containing protein [Deltaproteobacteria bacterium]MBW2321891.1 nucleotidyltransferase domain-containing protein [Deltaproteobacteria bacterium]